MKMYIFIEMVVLGNRGIDNEYEVIMRISWISKSGWKYVMDEE